MYTTIGVTDLRVGVGVTPLKNKTNPALYDLYLIFKFWRGNIQVAKPLTITMGKQVPLTQWNVSGRQFRGTTAAVQVKNTQLHDLLTTARNKLAERFKDQTDVTVDELTVFLKEHLRPELTGFGVTVVVKKKTLSEDDLHPHSLKTAIKSKVDYGALSRERARIYQRPFNLFIDYLRKHHAATKQTKAFIIPLITEINKEQLTAFKKWLDESYRVSRGKRKGLPLLPNTSTTWLTMMAAVFNHAVAVMKILPKSPLPDLFRGSFVDADRVILSDEECLAIMGLDEIKLNAAKRRAKYCLILQMLTGIQYCDLRTLRPEHVEFDSDYSLWFITRRREKNKRHNGRDIAFEVSLTPKAKASFDNLRILAPGEMYLFHLPSINAMNRQYKTLAKMVGITKDVATYTMRHTFAVKAIDAELGVEVVQKQLGHKDIRQTQTYTKISRKRQHRANLKLLAKSPIHKQ